MRGKSIFLNPLGCCTPLPKRNWVIWPTTYRVVDGCPILFVGTVSINILLLAASANAFTSGELLARQLEEILVLLANWNSSRKPRAKRTKISVDIKKFTLRSSIKQCQNSRLTSGKASLLWHPSFSPVEILANPRFIKLLYIPLCDSVN